MRRLVALALVVAAAGCGGDGTASAPAGPYDYDASAPLASTTREVAEAGGVRTHEVRYASGASGDVAAYLLEPAGKAGGAPVIYLHGGGGSRADLLPVAVGWVRQGGRALLIDAAPVRAGAATALARLRAQRQAEIDTVIRVRRAVDLLDADRVGFVGWSAGARTGAIVAAVEPRIDAFALMSGGAAPLDAYVAEAPPELRAQVRRLLADVDPLRWVKRARPNTIFFQNGRRDEVVPRGALENLVRAARRPQRVRWYDAAHALSAAAYDEQYAWLGERLGR